MAKPAIATTGPRPDVREMITVHRLFRRELTIVPPLIREVGENDRARTVLLCDHVQDVLAGLHHHHTGEDELLWPVLLERVELEKGLVHSMEAEHEQIAQGLEVVAARLSTWRRTASQADAELLAAAIDEVRPLLLEHLDAEERHILPLARTHLRVEEWDRLGERGFAATPRNKRLIVLGAILEDAPPAEQVAMLAKVPLPGRVAWRLFGRRRYQARMRQIRGGVTMTRSNPSD